MSRVELFERIRRDRRDPSVSQRELARRHGVSRKTVVAALSSALPPPRKPVTGRPRAVAPVASVIDQMLRSDVTAPKKQQHTIERICQRLAHEHDFREASYSAVRDYVAMRRPQIAAEVRDGQEAFIEGHIEAFRVLGGVPTRHVRYDNLSPAVAKVLLGRSRKETQRWLAFRSHMGFDAFYCQPGAKGAHEKGTKAAGSGEATWSRRRSSTPSPSSTSASPSSTRPRTPGMSTAAWNRSASGSRSKRCCCARRRSRSSSRAQSRPRRSAGTAGSWSCSATTRSRPASSAGRSGSA